MAKKLKPLAINLKRWYRGTPGSSLLRKDGRQCCLGFLGSSCGFSNDRLNGLATPDETTRDKTMLPSYWSNLAGLLPTWPKGVLDRDGNTTYDSDWTNEAVDLNDRLLGEESLVFEPDYVVIYTDEQRQALLKKHFRKIGYDVTFVNE